MKSSVEKKTIYPYLHWLIPLFIFLLIMCPLLFGGVFLVDYTSRPHPNIVKDLFMSNFIGVNPANLVEWVFAAAGLWNYFFQISLLITFYVSYIYIRKLTRYGALFFFIYTLNPFVYSRIMVGQIWLLTSYFLFPVFLYYLMQSVLSPENYRNWLFCSLVSTIIVSFSLHFFPLILFALFVTLFWYFIKTSPRNKLHTIRGVSLFLVTLLLLNVFWIQALFSSNSTVSSIGLDDEIFFAPKLTEGVPTIVKIIGMWGFWREHGYISTYKTLPLPLWYFLTLLILLLFSVGYYVTFESKQTKVFFTFWWIGLILATGISHPYTRPLFDFLFTHVPFFNGFRDSHKFVLFVALAYAYLIPYAIVSLKDKTYSLFKKKYISYGVMILALLLFIVYTYPLFGLWNQAHAANIPQSYEDVGKYLNRQNITGHVVYLPWHNYLTYRWSINTSPGGRIPVPINNYVSSRVIIGPDEWGGENELQQKIDLCLVNESLSCLEKTQVQYVLKDSCATFPDIYPWLNTTRVHTTPCVTLYKLHPLVPIKFDNHVPIRVIVSYAISLISIFGIIVYFLFTWRQKNH
jgi:hypothetical protein